MLTEPQTRLITAAIDGELSAGEARELATLLATSAAARRLHDRLRRNAADLRALRPVRPRRDLATAVMAAVQPTTAAVPHRARVPAWLVGALAASVLFVIGTFSFLLATRPTGVPGQVDSPTVRIEPAVPPPSVLPKSPESLKVDPSHPPRERGGRPGVIPRSAPKPERLPPPKPLRGPGELLAAPGQAPLTLQEVDRSGLPLIFSGKAPADETLRPAVRADTPLRIDWFVADLAAALRGLKAGLSSGKGVGLAADRVTGRALAYADCLQPDRVRRLLADLVTHKGSRRVVVSAFTAEDDRRLARRLGIPTSRFRVGRLRIGSTEVRPDDPLSVETAKRVAAALSRKQRPRPLVLVTSADGFPASPAVRKFLKHHRPHPAGTTPLFVVLRELP